MSETEDTTVEEPIAGATEAATQMASESVGPASNAAPRRPAALPASLVDRMVGRLGTSSQMHERGVMFQQALGPALEEMLQLSTGLEIDVRPGKIRMGRRRELWAELIDGSVYCTGHVRKWADEVSYFCGAPLVIGLVECLLGGADPETIEAVTRPLSAIELDMSLVIFENLSDVVASAVSQAGEPLKANVDAPSAVVPEEIDDPAPDCHAAAIGFEIEFAGSSTVAYFIAPQEQLLKTKPVKRATIKDDEAKAQSDWRERLSKRVVRSDVRLEARIALDQMRLADISRLQPGDVLAFPEETGARVILGGNGKDIYNCALGRTGQRYMVRIEDPTGVDENWRAAFT
ncbi:hypothetical protein E2A64_03815 [Pseudohoeflea suaedae]|uniref:Flagellar motor switch protein FliM n=1 Tax=Pseudohoeflea suaedae TaxID=877384 RepID=A0A4R5PML7_9HYPH|nr:FliM/FliN family flagellar motor switch protein [Pseudohoeflea suaedae]TDH38254.1 hypothetical protein E2A64_03815 [Pseudohoeflea suaedae]